MAKNRRLTDKETYAGHPILTNKEKGYKCDKKILDKIEETFEHVLEDHGMDRVFFMRYDVRFPKDKYVETKQGNTLFRRFQSKFIKSLERHDLKPHYVAAREQSREKNGHYHTVLLLDERKTQNIKKHIEKADELWGNTIGLKGQKGLIDDCTKDRNGKPQKNGLKIKKNSSEFADQLDKTFQWSSYLAKKNTKTTTSERELFSSRLNHNIERKKK